jgi:hypothetical protein
MVADRIGWNWVAIPRRAGEKPRWRLVLFLNMNEKEILDE